MSGIIKKYPALSFFILAVVLGTAPIAFVLVGLLPTEFTQLGAFSGSLAGVILAAVASGKSGVKELLSRVLVWRVGFEWWGFAIFFTAIIAAATLWLSPLVGGPQADWTILCPIWSIIPMMFVLTLLAGLGEEFGWRGFLIPRLQAQYSALVSSLIIGGLHSLWHVPLFLVAGTAQSRWAQEVGVLPAFLGYSVFVIAWAVQLSWVFNNTKGSVLLAAVVHGVGNAWTGGYLDVYGQIGMIGIAILSTLMAVASLIILFVAGPEHLSQRNERDKLEIEELEDQVRHTQIIL